MLEKSTGFVVVLSTVDKLESAHQIAEELVQNRLAACVQVEGPLTSFYQWEGKLESANEFRLVIKTTVDSEEGVYEQIRKLHSYDVPQILTVPVSAGLAEYLHWVRSETS